MVFRNSFYHEKTEMRFENSYDLRHTNCISFDFQAGHENLHLALSLVEYESELQKAMEYVFGTTLICNNMDNAKKVTFDKRIMTRSVTLDGDTFDPQGTLHGGNC